MNKKIFFILFAILSVSACGDDNGDNNEFNGIGEISDNTELTIGKDAIDRIIDGFSSPVEMAALIEDLKVPYSSKYMLDTKKVDDFDTNFKKALGLGMLSADLGYLNVYKKVNDILGYLIAIKHITDDLDVDKFFDFQTLKQLATNSDDLDSLMFLSVNSYHRMDEHLRKTKRSDLSALMVTGVWLEGLFLATQVKKHAESKDLRERIGENKQILSDLVVVLKFFEKKPHFKELIAQMDELSKAYEGVKITIVIGGPPTIDTDKVSGIVTTTPSDYTEVKMSDDQLNDIINIIEKVRNNLINL